MQTMTPWRRIPLLFTLLGAACAPAGATPDSGTPVADSGTPVADSGGAGGLVICANTAVADSNVLLGYRANETISARCQAPTLALAACLRAVPGICTAAGTIDTTVALNANNCAAEGTTAVNCKYCVDFTAATLAFSTQPSFSNNPMGSPLITADITVTNPQMDLLNQTVLTCQLIDATDAPVPMTTCNPTGGVTPEPTGIMVSGNSAGMIPAGMYRIRVTARARMGIPEADCASRTFTSMPVIVP